MATSEENGRLTAKQEEAVELRAAGLGTTAVAGKLHVNRSTLNRWMTLPAFRAAYLQRRQELHEAFAGQLIGTVHAALDLVQKAIQAGDLRAASHVLSWVPKSLVEDWLRGDDEPGGLSQSEVIDQVNALFAAVDQVAPDKADEIKARALLLIQKGGEL